MAGKYSEQTGIVNFSPNAPLPPNTTFDVIVPAGGIKDYAGNPVATTFSSSFTTGASGAGYSCTIIQNPPALVNQVVTFDIQSCDSPGPYTYSWNFGDGSPATPFSSTSSATHSYSAPGHYLVIATVVKGGLQNSFNVIQTITNPTTPVPPCAFVNHRAGCLSPTRLECQCRCQYGDMYRCDGTDQVVRAGRGCASAECGRRAGW